MVCFKKVTGTITEGKPSVEKVVAFDTFDENELLKYSASLNQYSEHPLAEAVRTLARDENIALVEPQNFESGLSRGVVMSSSPSRPLRERGRAPSEAELAGIPWLAWLGPGDQDLARNSIVMATAGPGEQICRIGRPATYWFGLVDGLLKMSNEPGAGAPITFTGVPPARG